MPYIGTGRISLFFEEAGSGGKRLPEPQRLVLQQELVRVQAVLAGIRSRPAPARPATAER